MIYTIGHKDGYLSAMAAGPVYKTGRREPSEKFPGGYEGGYAFQTIEDAQRRIAEAYAERGFAVFGLEAAWEQTEPDADGWWHNLLVDALVIIV